MIDGIFDMFPRLRERSTQNAGTLSGGEQQMLVLGRAMMSEPQLLCLDEPSLGLAPLVVQDIFRTIRAINAAGTSVLLVEQNARYALETASRGYVLQTGASWRAGLRGAQTRCARARGLSRPDATRCRFVRSQLMAAIRQIFAGRKIAVVTGAGTGIGRAIALAFGEAGAAVACVDLEAQAAQATAAASCEKRRRRLCPCAAMSATRPMSAPRRRRFWRKFPAIHVLVNGAAGHDPNGTVLDLTLADWNRVFAVNVGGAFLMSRAHSAGDDRGGRRQHHPYRVAARQRCGARARGLLRLARAR